MDTRRILEHPTLAPVLSVTFNHDNSWFAVGLEHGFRGKSRKKALLLVFDIVNMGQNADGLCSSSLWVAVMRCKTFSW